MAATNAKTLAVSATDSKFETLALNKIDGIVERTTTIAGVEDKYFLATFILPLVTIGIWQLSRTKEVLGTAPDPDAATRRPHGVAEAQE